MNGAELALNRLSGPFLAERSSCTMRAGQNHLGKDRSTSSSVAPASYTLSRRPRSIWKRCVTRIVFIERLCKTTGKLSLHSQGGAADTRNELRAAETCSTGRNSEVTADKASVSKTTEQRRVLEMSYAASRPFPGKAIPPANDHAPPPSLPGMMPYYDIKALAAALNRLAVVQQQQQQLHPGGEQKHTPIPEEFYANTNMLQMVSPLGLQYLLGLSSAPNVVDPSVPVAIPHGDFASPHPGDPGLRARGGQMQVDVGAPKMPQAPQNFNDGSNSCGESSNSGSPTSQTSFQAGSSPTRNNQLYKTELCRSFSETGFCRYGAKCQFAHGGEELRPVARHPKYKTEVCRTFKMMGTCPYGTRCRFIHHSAPRGTSSSHAGGSNRSGPSRESGPTPGPTIPGGLEMLPPVQESQQKERIPVLAASYPPFAGMHPSMQAIPVFPGMPMQPVGGVAPMGMPRHVAMNKAQMHAGLAAVHEEGEDANGAPFRRLPIFQHLCFEPDGSNA
eukprot:jgi/Mesvir1/9667/Mv12152-RA.1